MQGEPLSEEDGKLVLRLMEKVWGHLEQPAQDDSQKIGEGGSEDETD